MAMTDEEIGAKLSLKGRREFSSEVDRAQRDVRGFSDTIDKAGRRMSIAARGGMTTMQGAVRGIGTAVRTTGIIVAAALAGIVAYGVQGFNAMKRINTITAQTNAVIESTGGVANVTAKHLLSTADALEALTGHESEAIQEGQNLLLTFTKVRNEAGKGNAIFDRATKSMVDMAQALPGATEASAALLLGKALNDPVKGMTALTRAGVSFTQQQKDQVKAMVASGDMIGAQKVILRELETQFGGSAEAFGNTTEGLIARIRNAWGNLQEGIVGRMMPTVDRGLRFVLGKLQGLVDRSDEWLPKIERRAVAVGDAFSNIGKQAGNLFRGVRAGDTRAIAEVFDNMLGNSGRTIGPVTKGLDKMVAIGGDLSTIWRDAVWPAMKDVARLVPDFLRPIGQLDKAVRWLADHAKELRPFVAVVITLAIAVGLLTSPWLAAAAAVGAAIAAYNRIEGVRETVDRFVAWFRADALPVLRDTWDSVVVKWRELVAWGRRIWPQVQEAITHVVNVVQILWSRFGKRILGIARTVFGQVYGWVKFYIGMVRGVIELVLAVINGDWGKAWGALVGLVENALGFVLGTVKRAGTFLGQLWGLAISALWQLAKAGFGKLLDVATSLLGKLIVLVMTKRDEAVAFIRLLPSMIASVLSGAWGAVTGKVSELFGGVVKLVRGYVDELVGFWTGMPGRLAAVGRGMFDFIKTAFKGAINWVIRGWNRLEFRIPGFDPPGPGPTFGGFTLGMPDIKPLHQGGQTTSSGAVKVRPDEELIYLPKAATVAPLDTGPIVGALRQASESGVPVHATVVLPDGRVLVDVMVQGVRDQAARK